MYETSRRGRRDFVSTSVAPNWDAGVIVGSGRVGAIIWGAPAEHHISLCHELFFLPINPRPLPPDLVAARRSARRSLLDGDAESAARLIDEAAVSGGVDGLVWTDPLAPCATLSIRATGSDGAVSRYERWVDLEGGAARIAWRSADEDLMIEVRAPRGRQRVEVAAHAGAGRMIEARLAATGASEDGSPLEALPQDRGIEVHASWESLTSGSLSVIAEGVTPGTGRRATTRITTDAAGALLEVEPDAVRIHATVPLDGQVEFALELDVGMLSGPSAPVIDVGEHDLLHRASWLDLCSGVDPSVPTELLHREAARDERMRRALVELAYAAGRYAIIASTGELPATLQGVWQGSWTPAWSSDYTMNGNLQNGGAASLVPTGTPQLMRALTRLLTSHLEDYRVNARRIFGFEGAMLPSRMSTHGLANHFSHDYPHQFWTGAGGWVLRMLADAVLATGDRTLVDDGVWTLAVEIMRFYRMLAAEGPIAPGYSPENTPRGQTTPLSVQPTMDAAILRDASRAFEVLAEARGEDVRETFRSVVPEAAYRVTTDGMLAEWGDPRFEDHLEHRHTSQLYPLWYDQDEAFDAPLRTAARELVRAKIAWRASDTRPPPGHMEMAFGLAQLGLAAAALGDGDGALRCVEWLATAHFTVAMTSTHDAGEIFNVDAGGALPAVVASMLVQSTRSSISLLPALPLSWPAGGAGGLTTRTGLVVRELRWDETGVVATLHGQPESAWVRGDGVRLTLPAPMTMHTPTGWSAPSTSFDLGETDGRELELRWERQERPDTPVRKDVQ